MSDTTRLDRVAIAVLIATIAVFLGFSIPANADLTAHRAFLFMDELITFDGVRNILHPNGKRSFLLAVLDGGDQRYGRILWNVLAIVSWIPERLAGVPGQIFASRELQPVLQIATNLLLAITFVRRWIWRALLVMVLCVVPYTVFYATWVKPEPLQLLLLSLFFWRLKVDGTWKPWSWIFLGLAFGAKISVAPVVGAAFVTVAVLLWRERVTIAAALRRLATVAVAFIVGWFAAVPTLALIPLRPAYFAGYMGWTFLMTTHGADDRSVRPIDWLEHLVRWWAAPTAVVVVALLLAIIAGALALWRAGDDRWRLLPWVAGLLLLAPIILIVKRLWGFYLYPGTVLFIVGSAAGAELLFDKAERGAARWIAVALPCVFAPMAIGWGWPAMLADFRLQAHRTATEEFTSKRAMWVYVNELLAKNAAPGRPVTAYYAPHLFSPDTGPRVNANAFWGPFLLWTEGRDFVIMRRELTPEVPLPALTSAEYDEMRRSHELFRTHVIGDGRLCRVAPCYDMTAPTGFPDLRVFHRRDTGASR